MTYDEQLDIIRKAYNMLGKTIEYSVAPDALNEYAQELMEFSDITRPLISPTSYSEGDIATARAYMTVARGVVLDAITLILVVPDVDRIGLLNSLLDVARDALVKVAQAIEDHVRGGVGVELP